MREVAKSKILTEGEIVKKLRFSMNIAKISDFSLPQSASLTAPSSEGANISL